MCPINGSGLPLASSGHGDPAATQIDQLKEIWIDGGLEMIETVNWVQKLMRKDFTFALSLSGSAVDDLLQSSMRIIAAARRATTGAIATRSRSLDRPAIGRERPGTA